MVNTNPKIRKQQLLEAIKEYLENSGLIQKSLQLQKSDSLRRLEMNVRSLNLRRLP